MKKVAITGNIGVGKSMVCSIFATMGIPIFNADDEAKKLYHLPSIAHKIKNLLGEDVYTYDGKLQTENIAKIVFSDPQKLQSLENILHPLVLEQFEQWIKTNKAMYCILESAIIFEKNWQNFFDAIILVVAPKYLQLQRLNNRYQGKNLLIQQRLKLQIPTKIKRRLANYVIVNDEKKPLIPQIFKIHQNIIKINK